MDGPQGGRPRAPATVAVGTALLGLAIYGTLLALGSWWDATSGLGEGFPLWAGVATISALVWTAVLVAGVRTVRRRSDEWERSRRWWLLTLLRYIVLAGLVSALLRALTSGLAAPPSGIGFQYVVVILTAYGWVCASPWVVLVWIAHEEVETLDRMIAAVRRPPASDEFASSDVDGENVNRAVRRVEALWRVAESSTLALGALLSTLVLNTGTLRALRIQAEGDADVFPPVYVLAYGAFFALVVAVIVLPLLAAWRGRGLRLVEVALPVPMSGVPSDSQVGARERLVARLGLGARIVRSPVTALGVLSPFLTAVVTTLFPSDQ